MLALNPMSPPQVSEALAARLLPVLPLSWCAARLHLRVFYSARGLNTVCILSTLTNNTTMTSPHPKRTRDANKSYFWKCSHTILSVVKGRQKKCCHGNLLLQGKKRQKNNEPSEEEDFSRAAKGLIRVHLFLRSPTCFTKAEFTFWDQVTLAVYFWLLSILFLKLCLITWLSSSS